MRLTSLILFLALTVSASAQSLVVVTNIRSALTVSEGVALQNVAGTYRFTFTVEQTAGVPIDLDDGSTFRLDIVNKADRYRVSTTTNNTTPEISLTAGQLRFTPSGSLATGSYEVTAWVTPLSGTNDQWKAAWHTLTVTPSVSTVASISLSPLYDLAGSLGEPTKRWLEIHASTGTFSSLIISNLSVAGAISAVDTTAVKLAGSTINGEMSGALTNRSAGGFVGNGVGLTNLSGVVSVSALVTLSNAVAQAVTNNGATVNGSPITNGAAITISSAVDPSKYVYLRWSQHLHTYSAITWADISSTNECIVQFDNPSGTFTTNLNAWSYAPGTSGIFVAYLWGDEAAAAQRRKTTGMTMDGVPITNSYGNLYGVHSGEPYSRYMGIISDNYANNAAGVSGPAAMMKFKAQSSTNVFRFQVFPENAEMCFLNGALFIERIGGLN